MGASKEKSKGESGKVEMELQSSIVDHDVVVARKVRIEMQYMPGWKKNKMKNKEENKSVFFPMSVCMCVCVCPCVYRSVFEEGVEGEDLGRTVGESGSFVSFQ